MFLCAFLNTWHLRAKNINPWNNDFHSQIVGWEICDGGMVKTCFIAIVDYDC